MAEIQERNDSIFSYAILSIKVCHVLSRMEKEKEIEDVEYKILERGTSIIAEIIEGSILIDNKQESVSGFSPSQKGLLAYRHALSAIESLETLSKGDDLTNRFLEYYKEIKNLSNKDISVNKDSVSSLKIFFEALSRLFDSDLMESTYREPIEMTRLSINAS